MQTNQTHKKQTQKQEKLKEGVKYSIKLTISTWNKDSHGLYDYQSTLQSYKTQNFKIQNSTIIYRDALVPRNLLVSKEEPKQVRDSYGPIAHLIFQKKRGKVPTTVKFQPIQATPLDLKTFDSSKTFYKVIREKNLQGGNNDGLALKPGYIIKMGRIQYLVVEIKNSRSCSSFTKNTNHFNQSNGIFTHVKTEHIVEEDGNQIRCKVCLFSEETDEDPLISPCQCKGSLKKIHLGCLKQWINSKVKKQINDIATSYNFTKFQCEICLTPFPKIVKVQDRSLQMMTISKPDKPYIILQSLNKVGEQGKQDERCLHLISAKENSQIKIGRGHQCQIRLTDISVSRSHAKIVFVNDQFFIKDEKSKFGTLVKLNESHSFEHGKPFRVQYGRSLFDFELDVHQQEDTEQEFEIKEVQKPELEPVKE